MAIMRSTIKSGDDIVGIKTGTIHKITDDRQNMIGLMYI